MGGENRRATTSGSWALEEDLFGGDHGEARAGVVPLDGVAELGPRAALDGAPGETRAREEAAGAGGGDDLDLVALAVEAVLDHPPEAARVGLDDDPRREEEEAEVAGTVIVRELAPLVLALLRRHRRRHGSPPVRSPRALGLWSVRRWGG